METHACKIPQIPPPSQYIFSSLPDLSRHLTNGKLETCSLPLCLLSFRHPFLSSPPRGHCIRSQEKKVGIAVTLPFLCKIKLELEHKNLIHAQLQMKYISIIAVTSESQSQKAEQFWDYVPHNSSCS